jgi:hypothetical protein
MPMVNREKQWKPFAETEKILQEFQEAKISIEEMTGLSLSNIELVGLRKITENFMKELVEQKIAGAKETMLPADEIPARFFLEFYDMDPGTYIELTSNESGNFNELEKEWFRIEQERRHLI